MIDLEIISYSKFNDNEKFLEFCKQASTEKTQPASVNMWHKNWKQKPETLAFQIFNKQRYFKSNGEFLLALYDDQIIGCSGVYKSTFNDAIALAGCRTWISKKYRNLSIPREYLLPLHKEWALANNCKIIALTFNDYNKNIITSFTRLRLGETRTPRQSHHLFYNNFNEVPFPVSIQFSKQWVIFEKLDNDWNFDWTTIKYYHP